jgi:hypothetical protein
MVEGGEGVVDALGVEELAGVFGERGGEVLGVAGLQGDMAVAVGIALVGDDGGALASGGGTVAAAFVGVHGGVVRGDHGLGFSPGAGFLLGGVYPPVLQKTCWKLLETKKTGVGLSAKKQQKEHGTLRCVIGWSGAELM